MSDRETAAKFALELQKAKKAEAENETQLKMHEEAYNNNLTKIKHAGSKLAQVRDKIAKYDPSANKWTMFELPVRGTEIRHVSLMERDGKTKVIVPVYRSSQMGVMTLRSEAELAALKAQAK